MRCFLGIPIPADCRNALREAWQPSMLERPNFKLSDPGQWHITLAFFGEIEFANLIELTDLIQRALETPPQGAFEVTAIKSFPDKRPTMIVAECEAHDSRAWHDCVLNIKNMASIIAPQTDHKPWHPHVTMARAKHGRMLDAFMMNINNVGWVPEDAILYQSELTLHGPIFTPLHEFKLII